MARIKDRTYVLNRSSKPNQPARNRPVSSITRGLCLHATRPTPKTDEPALQAALSPLAQTVENAPVRRSPYDSTFASLEIVTSSTTSLQASEHAILHLKRPFSGKSPYKSSSTYHEFLCITPSLCCCERFPTRSYPSRSSCHCYPSHVCSPVPHLPVCCCWRVPCLVPPALRINPVP